MDPPRAGTWSTTTGFQPASTLLTPSPSSIPATTPTSTSTSTTHAPSTSSNRNASGGLPDLKRPGPYPSTSSSPAASPSTSSAAAADVSANLATGSIKPVHRPIPSKNAIVYSAVQRRNPVLGMIRNIGLELGDIPADYQVGAHSGVLFLSLKYHRLHPEYIHQRIEKIRNAYKVRILLVYCDIAEHHQSIRELSKIAIINELTILVAWSNEEAAQYLSTLKAYEHKSADTLKERVHQTYTAQLDHVLTSGRKVNKTDSEALAAQFGSFANIVHQSNHALGNVKGLGPVKVVSLMDAFNKPFIAGGLNRGPQGANRNDATDSGSVLAVAAAASASVDSTAAQDDGQGTATTSDATVVLASSREVGDVDEKRKRKGGDEEEDAFGSNGGTDDTDNNNEDLNDSEVPVDQIHEISRDANRDRELSRSPSVPPEEGRAGGEDWHDPLDDDDSDEEEEPASKRTRREGG